MVYYIFICLSAREKILSQDSRVVARGFNFGKIIWSKAASNAGQKMSYLGLGWKRNFLTEWERLVPGIYAGSLTHRRTPHTVEPTSDSVSDPAYMPGTPYSRVRDLMTNIGEWELRTEQRVKDPWLLEKSILLFSHWRNW